MPGGRLRRRPGIETSLGQCVVSPRGPAGNNPGISTPTWIGVRLQADRHFIWTRCPLNHSSSTRDVSNIRRPQSGSGRRIWIREDVPGVWSTTCCQKRPFQIQTRLTLRAPHHFLSHSLIPMGDVLFRLTPVQSRRI